MGAEKKKLNSCDNTTGNSVLMFRKTPMFGVSSSESNGSTSISACSATAHDETHNLISVKVQSQWVLKPPHGSSNEKYQKEDFSV